MHGMPVHMLREYITYYSMERFVENCERFLHDIDSELLDKFDVFFDFKYLSDGRYLMSFKRYRRHGRHPKTVAWLEFNNRRVIDVSNNVLGHVLNSMYFESFY
jgi:hypothetical protein